MVEEFGKFRSRIARDSRITQLRARGYSMSQIAKDIGMSKAGVQNALDRMARDRLEVRQALIREAEEKRNEAFHVPAPPRPGNYQLNTVTDGGSPFTQTYLRCTVDGCPTRVFGEDTPGVFDAVPPCISEQEQEILTAKHNLKHHPNRAYVFTSAGWVKLSDLVIQLTQGQE